MDLLNTAWRDADRKYDLFLTVGGLREWLRERQLPSRRADERMRQALLHTREALRDLVNQQPGADECVNAVLARGLIVRELERGRIRERVLCSDDAWLPAWHAAADHVRLRAACPTAIRRCAHPACVLYFYDPSGRRRWCSMTGCGNRAKAQRHYKRTKSAWSAPVN